MVHPDLGLMLAQRPVRGTAGRGSGLAPRPAAKAAAASSADASRTAISRTAERRQVVLRTGRRC